MKNMKKVLAVMTAVSAMAASTSAFAAPIAVDFDVANFDATYDVETNKFAVTLTDYTAAEDMTLLILDKDVADEANVQDGEIRYIDQGKAFANAGLKLDELATQLAPGSYPVKLGYDDGDSFEIAEATLVIPEPSSGDEPIIVKVLWGDVDLDGSADTMDATRILDAFAGGTSTFPQTDYKDGYKYTWNSKSVIGSDEKSYTSDILWGDIDADGSADTMDATRILDAFAGGTSTFTADDKIYKWNDSEDLANISLTVIEN